MKFFKGNDDLSNVVCSEKMFKVLSALELLLMAALMFFFYRNLTATHFLVRQHYFGGTIFFSISVFVVDQIRCRMKKGKTKKQ